MQFFERPGHFFVSVCPLKSPVFCALCPSKWTKQDPQSFGRKFSALRSAFSNLHVYALKVNLGMNAGQVL